jgi:hypothetical protein
MQKLQPKLGFWSTLKVWVERTPGQVAVAILGTVTVLGIGISALLVWVRLRGMAKKRAAMARDNQDLDLFGQSFKDNVEGRLLEIRKGTEREQLAINSLLERSRSPEVKFKSESEEIGRQLKLILCKIFDLRNNAGDGLIKGAHAIVIVFDWCFPTDDKQAQQLCSLMWEMGKTLGWNCDPLELGWKYDPLEDECWDSPA